MSLLVLDRISKVYQSEDGDHLALDNVTFSLPSTGLMGVVGKSGSGKSTILNALLERKVSIVCDKPQTTRNTIKGIYDDDEYQIF